MPDPQKPPVATLRGLTLPGTGRTAGPEALGEHVAVLRANADGKGWRSIPPAAGMAIHQGDVIRLKGGVFAAYGARSFTVDNTITAGGDAPGLELVAHERAHQAGAPVVPMNEADADSIERSAEAIESMILNGGHAEPPGTSLPVFLPGR